MAMPDGWCDVLGVHAHPGGVVDLVLKTREGECRVSLLWEQWLAVALLLVAVWAELHGIKVEADMTGRVSAIDRRHTLRLPVREST